MMYGMDPKAWCSEAKLFDSFKVIFWANTWKQTIFYEVPIKPLDGSVNGDFLDIVAISQVILHGP